MTVAIALRASPQLKKAVTAIPVILAIIEPKTPTNTSDAVESKCCAHHNQNNGCDNNHSNMQADTVITAVPRGSASPEL